MKQKNKILIDELLIKYLTGTATLQEREDVLVWIHKSDKNGKYFDELKDCYEASILAKKVSKEDREESWERIKVGYYRAKYSNHSQSGKMTVFTKILRYAMPIAASVLIAFFLGSLLQKNKDATPVNRENVFTHFIVPKGSRSQVILPDQTKVWLNSESKLKYPNDFNSRNREVFLEGEAFFDVAHDMSKRFIVNTSDIKIRVYGTKFNVKSYPKENIVETTLEEGLISMVANKQNKKEVFLRPNESIIYYKKKSSTKDTQNIHQDNSNPGIFKPIQQTNPLDITSWKDNRLIFNETRIEDMISDLERWYNINIIVKDKKINDIRIKATFTVETVEQVIRAICMAADIDYELNKNTVVFKEKDPVK